MDTTCERVRAHNVNVRAFLWWWGGAVLTNAGKKRAGHKVASLWPTRIGDGAQLTTYHRIIFGIPILYLERYGVQGTPFIFSRTIFLQFVPKVVRR